MAKEEAPSTVATMDVVGRLVLKKDIRNALGIKNGDTVSLTTKPDGTVILRKYNPLAGVLSPLSVESAAALSDTIGHPIAICDNTDTIVAGAGGSQKLVGKTISQDLAAQISSGQTDRPVAAVEENVEWESLSIAPIIKDDVVFGAVLLLRNNQQQPREITDSDLTAMQTIAAVLTKKIDF